MSERPPVSLGPVAHFLYQLPATSTPSAANSNIKSRAGPEAAPEPDFRRQKLMELFQKTFRQERSGLFFVSCPGRRVRRTLQTKLLGFRKQPKSFPFTSPRLLLSLFQDLSPL